jgi:pilus assembly protein TadC
MFIDFLILSFALGLITLYTKSKRLSNSEEKIQTDKKPYSFYPAKTMRHAGLLESHILPGYWGVKLLLPILSILIIRELALELPFLMMFALFSVLFFAPDVWIMKMAKSRKVYIEKTLSFFLDQVIAFMLCGLNLDQALKQATIFGLPKTSPLRKEMTLIDIEISKGRSRSEAFEMLALRTGVDEMKSLVLVLNSAFDIGGSVVATLQEHSELLRMRQREKSSKRINSKLVISTVPLVLSNFPIFLLLVFFTPLLEFSRMFPKLGG